MEEALATKAKKNADVDMEVGETCILTPFKEHHRNVHHEGGAEGNGSDEEGGEESGEGGQRVRCAQ